MPCSQEATGTQQEQSFAQGFKSLSTKHPALCGIPLKTRCQRLLPVSMISFLLCCSLCWHLDASETLPVHVAQLLLLTCLLTVWGIAFDTCLWRKKTSLVFLFSMIKRSISYTCFTIFHCLTDCAQTQCFVLLCTSLKILWKWDCI